LRWQDSAAVAPLVILRSFTFATASFAISCAPIVLYGIAEHLLKEN
jgi:hypothetical protein